MLQATANLFTLWEEARWLQEGSKAGGYAGEDQAHLTNSIDRPLIEESLTASGLARRQNGS